MNTRLLTVLTPFFYAVLSVFVKATSMEMPATEVVAARRLRCCWRQGSPGDLYGGCSLEYKGALAQKSRMRDCTPARQSRILPF